MTGQRGGPEGGNGGWDKLLRRILELTAEDMALDDVVARVASLVTEASGADVCFVHLVDDTHRRLVLAGATPPFDELAGTITLSIGEGVAGWVAERAAPAVVDDKWRDPRYKYIPALKGEEFASLVSVPMLHRGHRVVGVVNVHWRTPHHGTVEELAALTDVAGLLAGIVENARLYRRLAERETELERFAARTIELQELERRRLAADIHDGISQRLVSLWYHLSAADEANPGHPEVVARELGATKELATAALEEARRAIIGLRPAVLDDLGLGPGLESLAAGLSGLEAEVTVEACPLPPHVETALFRIAQEALQNVAKHARAEQVRVDLRPVGQDVRLTVADDGCGFDPDAVRDEHRPHAYGLTGMQERAALVGGRLRVSSRPGEGTTLTVTVPVPTNGG